MSGITKVWQTVITKCVKYYKVWQTFLPSATVFTKWDVHEIYFNRLMCWCVWWCVCWVKFLIDFFFTFWTWNMLEFPFLKHFPLLRHEISWSFLIKDFSLRRQEIRSSFMIKLISVRGHEICYNYLIKLFRLCRHDLLSC